MTDRKLHLASSSPRRREILSALGLEFTFGGVDLDESPLEGERADDTVLRLARAKAKEGILQCSVDQVVLAADTLVVVDDRVLGKPTDRNDALETLRLLSGRSHLVLTAVALRFAQRERTALSRTEVRFREIHPDEAVRYWQSGEPEGKAGAYAVQGLGGMFVTYLAGSFTGVVGLPVCETVALLNEAGIDVLARQSRESGN